MSRIIEKTIPILPFLPKDISNSILYKEVSKAQELGLLKVTLPLSEKGILQAIKTLFIKE